MAFLRKVQAGLTKVDIEEFVGQAGNLFFDIETGDFRLSDGVTPGGIHLGAGGTGGYILPTASTTTKGGVKVDGSTIKIVNGVISADISGVVATPLSVSVIDGANVVSGTINNITAIRFDTEAGFDITDLGDGAVKVGMNSTFKYWKVDGQQDLVANGLDTIEFVAGYGIKITTDPNADPKAIKITATDKTVTLYQDGQLTLTTGTIRWHNPTNITVNKIIARLAEAADNIVTVVVRKKGVAVKTIAIPANTVKKVEVADISMISDDYLTVDINTIGTLNKGSGLSMEFTYSFV
jgi:hypothetical protein